MPEVDDRTRILMSIINRLKSSMVLGRKDTRNGLWMNYNGEPCVQFIDGHLCKPNPGDIVLCNTGPMSKWKIAYFVEDRMELEGRYVLREIGSDHECFMGNESLSVLVGMSNAFLTDGHKQKIYQWAISKAFSAVYNSKADYFIRCGGAEFIEDDVIRIWMRSHVFMQEKTLEDGTVVYVQPKYVDVKFSKKTRLKDIVKALHDGGFSDDWKYLPQEPKNGMVGCAKITRDDLMKALGQNGAEEDKCPSS